MRDAVTIKLGGKEYSMLPAFSVWDGFEDETGLSLFEHVQMLYEGRALLITRARLVLLGLRAAEPDRHWTLERVKEALFEAGAWHEDAIRSEAELAQRLLYTPEQYAKKKAEWEKALKEEEQTNGLLSVF